MAQIMGIDGNNDNERIQNLINAIKDCNIVESGDEKQ